MVATHGPATASLNELARNIREYSLFNAVNLALEQLREAYPDLTEEKLYEQLEFDANPSLGFPGSDIDCLYTFEERGELRVRLRLNVIGLVGTGSPLPAFYSEQVLTTKGGDVARQFLGVFHHRLQRLMLPIWCKYRYAASYRTGATDTFSQRLFALIGLGGEQIRKSQALNWKRLLPYLGLLSARARSAALIEAVLRYYFNHQALYIEQCVERKVEIPHSQLNSLGNANSALGENLVLGERVRDRGGKFCVHVHRLSWARFHEFLPQGCSYQPLRALIRFILRDPLAYDLQLKLAQGEPKALCVGTRASCRLGWTTWLGQKGIEGVLTLGGLDQGG